MQIGPRGTLNARQHVWVPHTGTTERLPVRAAAEPRTGNVRSRSSTDRSVDVAAYTLGHHPILADARSPRADTSTPRGSALHRCNASSQICSTSPQASHSRRYLEPVRRTLTTARSVAPQVRQAPCMDVFS